jgi:Right handed beta helix region
MKWLMILISRTNKNRIRGNNMHRAWRLGLTLLILLVLLALLAYPQAPSAQGVSAGDEAAFVERAKHRADDPGTETVVPEGVPAFYFSSSTGDDTRDCRDREKPCKSTEKFVKMVKAAGAFGLFKRGDAWGDQSWLERMTSGKEGVPITVGVFGSGARPVFTKGKQTTSNFTKIMKKSYITFESLLFQKMQSFHIIDSSHHLDFINVVFRDAGNACVHMAGERDKTEAHHISFVRNTVENCGTTGNNGEGFYISESVKRYGFGGRDILIKDTIIRNTQHEPINIKKATRRIRVEGVVIHDYIPNRTAGKRDPGLINARLSDDPQAGHVFTRNIIVGNKGHGSEKDAAFFLVAGTTAFNNLVVGNNMACVRGDKGGKFYLNTCVRNVQGFLYPEPVRGSQQLDIADVRCNIGTNLGRNVPDDAEQFMDASHDDYRLRVPNADAAGGCDLGPSVVATDILGYERKGKVNFGAFEYVENRPPPIVPGGDCGALFGKAPGFKLCSETDTTCAFQATTAGTTCEGLCGAMGSTCVEAFNNSETSCMAEPGSEDTCQTPRNNEICVCSKAAQEPPLPEPVKPEPVSIGWCGCGCAQVKGDVSVVNGILVHLKSIGEGQGLSGVEKCVEGCAPCHDDGANVPLDKSDVIGPVE